jgi:hypothetical protein
MSVTIPVWLLPGLESSPAAVDGQVDICTHIGWDAVVDAMARFLWPDMAPTDRALFWCDGAYVGWTLGYGPSPAGWSGIMRFAASGLPVAALQRAAIHTPLAPPERILEWLVGHGWVDAGKTADGAWACMQWGDTIIEIPLLRNASDYRAHEKHAIIEVARTMGREPHGLRLDILRPASQDAA